MTSSLMTKQITTKSSILSTKHFMSLQASVQHALLVYPHTSACNKKSEQAEYKARDYATWQHKWGPLIGKYRNIEQ